MQVERLSLQVRVNTNGDPAATLESTLGELNLSAIVEPQLTPVVFQKRGYAWNNLLLNFDFLPAIDDAWVSEQPFRTPSDGLDIVRDELNAAIEGPGLVASPTGLA